MRSPLLFPALGLGLTLLRLSCQTSGQFVLKDSFTGDRFYNDALWLWETFDDPTRGRVNYVSKQVAQATNLTSGTKYLNHESPQTSLRAKIMSSDIHYVHNACIDRTHTYALGPRPRLDPDLFACYLWRQHCCARPQAHANRLWYVACLLECDRQRTLAKRRGDRYR
jgi:hypothetical protein